MLNQIFGVCPHCGKVIIHSPRNLDVTLNFVLKIAVLLEIFYKEKDFCTPFA